MKRETFIKSIEAIEKQYKEEMGDNDPDEYGQSWIEWFCFDKEFGTRKDIKAYHKDGSKIKLDTAGDLYDFLESEKGYPLSTKDADD